MDQWSLLLPKRRSDSQQPIFIHQFFAPRSFLQICGKFTKGFCPYVNRPGGCRNSHFCVSCRRWSSNFTQSCRTPRCPGATVQMLRDEREALERAEREQFLNQELEAFHGGGGEEYRP